MSPPGLLVPTRPRRAPLGDCETGMNPLPTFDLLDLALPHVRRSLLHGPPGCGKTFYATRCGLRDGQAVVPITMTAETPAEALMGHFVPTGDGTFTWMDGPAIIAWRSAARLVVNEIDHAAGDALDFLHVITDDPMVAAVTLPNGGEIVRPAEGFTIVATMNGEPGDLPDAIRDRMTAELSVLVDGPNPEAVNGLPTDLRDIAMGTVGQPDAPTASLRGWYAFASLRERIGRDAAAQAVFRERATEVLRSLEFAASTR